MPAPVIIHTTHTTDEVQEWLYSNAGNDDHALIADLGTLVGRSDLTYGEAESITPDGTTIVLSADGRLAVTGQVVSNNDLTSQIAAAAAALSATIVNRAALQATADANAAAIASMKKALTSTLAILTASRLGRGAVSVSVGPPAIGAAPLAVH